MNPIEVVAVLCLVCPCWAAAQGEPPRTVAPAPYQAECTLTPELVDRIVADLASEERSEAAAARLDEHEREHGWATGLSGPDFVDAAHGVACPEAVLARMAALPVAATKDISPWDLHCYFAIALQRAGRMSQALAILDAAIAVPLDEADPFASMFTSGRKSSLSQIAAKLCARGGRADRAFEYAKQWTSTSGCGNCSAGQNDEIKTFRARQLAKLGRHDEVIAIGCETMLDSWNTPGPALISLCIASEMGSRRCSDPATAVDLLEAEAKKYALKRTEKEKNGIVPFVGGTPDFGSLVSGKQLWELQNAPREVQLSRLSEIAYLDDDLALSLVFGFDNPVVGRHLDAFEIVDGHLRDPSLVCVLTRTGNPILELALDRATLALGEKEMDYERDLWKTAHGRWTALSRPR
jgi:hypothetical protein